VPCTHNFKEIGDFMNNIFSPITVKGFQIKNRIVMPPMVCFGGTDKSGQVTQKHIDHYEKRAKGGTGLIILEATCININGRLHETQLGIWCDEQIEGLSKIAKVCHNYGATALVQIHHAGFKTPKNVCGDIVAPSNYSDENLSARELTIDEIHEIQTEFVDAALRAKAAGFDGIELHGCHNYLINQFASPLINKRTDEYGGTLVNRMRFGTEIIEKIKNVVGEHFIIGYRVGGNEPTLENGIEIAKMLEMAGVDILNVSSGISDGNNPHPSMDFQFSWIAYMGTVIKKHVNIPVIAVNGIRNPKQASYLVENNLVDFAAIGRGLLADPEWVNKAKKEYEVNSCMDCTRCSWFTDGTKCPRNL